jgi:hypothetical protein
MNTPQDTTAPKPLTEAERRLLDHLTMTGWRRVCETRDAAKEKGESK